MYSERPHSVGQQLLPLTVALAVLRVDGAIVPPQRARQPVLAPQRLHLRGGRRLEGQRAGRVGAARCGPGLERRLLRVRVRVRRRLMVRVKVRVSCRLGLERRLLPRLGGAELLALARHQDGRALDALLEEGEQEVAAAGVDL